MSRRRRTGIGRFLPWSGIIGGFVGIAVVHQWGSAGLFNDCARYSPAVMAGVLGVGLLCIGIGAMGSIGVAYHSHETPERRFIALVSLGCAALFAVAILLPGTAGAINPICGG